MVKTARVRARSEGRRRALRAIVSLAALALVLASCAGALAPGAAAAAHVPIRRLCGEPRPGSAACLAMRLLLGSHASSSPGRILTRAHRRGARRAPAAGNRSKPYPGYLTPQLLHAAYALPDETVGSQQTIAVIDAFDDPTAEADLAVYDKQFGLPECTSANGCFRKLNQEGHASPLPAVEGEWAGETSIDVQLAHAICQGCHVLLVEANSEEFSDLAAAVDSAVSAGATEVSNSYGGPEEPSLLADDGAYDHPGVVIGASSGDCGYLNQSCPHEARAADFPADLPDVLAVGGTSLQETEGAWHSTVWKDGGSGCSTLFSAPQWQSSLADFTATGCGEGRSVADVAAIGDPETGVDIYDSTPEGNGDPTGWGVWGGTSVSSPIVTAEFALAQGAHGASDPAATLYAHFGEADTLVDVVSGSNGTCAGASSCQAGTGYDGPSGVGSPLGLGAFALPGSPFDTSAPVVTGVLEEGQTLSVEDGGWANAPTSFGYQWEGCNSAGASCSAIAGATASTYTLGAAQVGETIRVRLTGENAAGTGPPAVSAQSGVVVSDAPSIETFAPALAITGATVTITGSGLGGTSQVEFGSTPAVFKIISSGELQATVPDGARSGKISIVAAGGSASSTAKFTPTLSLQSFSPAVAPAGKVVKIKGVGFNSTSGVSFGGVPATSVTFVSAKKLTAVVPPGAVAGPVTVTNTAAPLGSVTSAGGFTP